MGLEKGRTQDYIYDDRGRKQRGRQDVFFNVQIGDVKMEWFYFFMLAIVVLMFGDKDKHYTWYSAIVALFDVIVGIIFFITKS